MEELQNILEPGFSAQEAIEILQGIHDQRLFPEEIFIQPPEPAILTDEGSDDEEEPNSLVHLPGRQLLGPAELVLSTGDRVSSFETQGPQLETQSKIASEIVPRIDQNPVIKWIQKRLKSEKNPTWIEGELIEIPRPFPNFSSTPYDSCVFAFEQFLTAEVVNLIHSESEKYNTFKNRGALNLTIDEVKCFIAILFLSGYNDHPSERHFWADEDDLQNLLVTKSIRKNRFIQIKQSVHCADNSKYDPQSKDKLWKLRPLINLVKKNIMENFTPSQNLDYDEAMIRYFGKHGCKQFIRGKPLRYGYKVWSINSNDGYLVNYEIYQGKNQHTPDDFSKAFGSCSAPFVVMLEEFPADKKELSYNFFFDNLFTGVNLFTFLKWKGYSATGTIRDNRIPKKCIIENSKFFKKHNRGTCKFAIEKKDGIQFVKWMDNGVVSLASTIFGVRPFSSVKRYSKAQKKNIALQRPLIVKKYNENMGGTDLMDRYINQYRIGVTGKKWWWPIFTWLLEVCMVNAWIMYKRSHPISQLNFRRSIVLAYAAKYGAPRARPGPATHTVPSKKVLDDIRFDRMDHLVIVTPDNKKKRCAGDGCKSIMRTMCQKCQVGLCIPCFAPFHKK